MELISVLLPSGEEVLLNLEHLKQLMSHLAAGTRLHLIQAALGAETPLIVTADAALSDLLDQEATTQSAH